MSPENLNSETKPFTTWRITGLIILSIRFVQGWIFWAGGSRRFIYDPKKLDPHAAQWMANKLQSAMPGALLGVGHIISFLLQHFILLFAAIIAFSLAELLCGLALILGCFTRLVSFITALISVTLMLIFGWEGGTCVDEWTMAISNLAMGLTLALSGAGVYSLDNWFLQRNPQLAQKKWFTYLASGPLPEITLKRFSLVYLVFTIFFTLTTYNYYRGAILSAYHAGPVSPRVHHLTLTEGHLESNGAVSFSAYVNAGTTALPSNIIRIDLVNSKGIVLEAWEGDKLSLLPKENIHNMYDYNRFTTGPFGLVAPVSAKAMIKLPPAINHLKLVPGSYQLQVYTINGHRWTLDLVFEINQNKI